MSTLKDVAKLANVDVSTVSRALNNSSYVHPDTKARIMEAVQELSYHPNVLAKGLRQGKRHTIGVVVPRLTLTIFSEILYGIGQAAGELGYSTLIAITDDNAALEKESLSRLRNGFVDGLILAATGHNNRIVRDVHADGMPVVQIVRQQIPTISSVVANYTGCGYEAVHYLYQKGCRHIGMINNSSNQKPYMNRYTGYRQAIQELNLEEYIAFVRLPGNTFEYGYSASNQLLDLYPELDAIMAAVDIQGIGAIRALHERGISIPGQVRVMSLTGHSVGAMLETGLTSMELPAHEMGVKAVKMLIESIEAPDHSNPSPQHLVFQASLVERESA